MTSKTKWGWFVAAAAFLLAGLGDVAFAFNQPPYNLNTTTFLDGGAPQGIYYINYTIFTEGKTPRGNDGKKIPGNAHVNVLVSLNQFYYLTPVKFLGGSLGLDVLIPIVSPTARGSFGPVPLTANTAGVGDIAAGPALQWDKGTLFGRPLFQRVELDFSVPTGKYDKNQLINPGTNILTIEGYYSFVWMFHPKWETSWRLFYAMNGENDDTKVKPGTAFHANYAFSYQVSPKLRLGAAGYFLQQLTEDELNGVTLNGSKERVMGVGPGFMYMGNGLMLLLSHPVEFSVRNRFQGSRTTLELIHRF